MPLRSPLIASLPRIGFGAFKIGRNTGTKYASSYSLPSDEECRHLLNGLLDHGCRYIDTAPAYGLSEQRIGEFLESRRAEFILSTKVGEQFDGTRSEYNFSRAAVIRSLEQSRTFLRRDVLDLVFIHAPTNDLDVLTKKDVVAVLREWREHGKIRAIGFSGKTVLAAEHALDWADALMVEYHSQDVSHAEVMALAASAGVGVIVKKGLASGRLPAAESIRFVLQNPSVKSLVIGGLNLQHFVANLQIAAECRA